MKIYICNSFALGMLDPELQGRGTPAGYVPRPQDRAGAVARIPRPLPVATDIAVWLRDWDDLNVPVLSAVGHADTARMFSNILCRDVPHNRIAVRLDPGDIALIGQLVSADGGPVRLPEGSTTLPPGVVVQWWTV